jgi:integrase/recombinase XerD
MSKITQRAVENLNNFENYLIDGAYSPNTIKGYINDLRLYSEWCNSEHKDLDVLVRGDIIEYKTYLKDFKGQDSKTVNHKLSSLKKYNEYLIDINAMDTVVIIKKDMFKVQAEFANPTDITEDEVKDFFNAIKNDKSKTSMRDFAIVYLLACTGIRISECLNLQDRNLNLDEQELTVNGKGNKQRIVYLNDSVCRVLKEYLNNNRNSKNYGDFVNSPYLFISNRSNKLTTSRVNQIFDKYNDKIHPHSLRHWFCSYAYESGMLLHEIANQAGHANIQITMRYTNPTKQALKNKMNCLQFV